MAYDFSKVVKIGQKILLSKGGLVVPLVKGDIPVPPEPQEDVIKDSLIYYKSKESMSPPEYGLNYGYIIEDKQQNSYVMFVGPDLNTAMYSGDTNQIIIGEENITDPNIINFKNINVTDPDFEWNTGTYNKTTNIFTNYFDSTTFEFEEMESPYDGKIKNDSNIDWYFCELSPYQGTCEFFGIDKNANKIYHGSVDGNFNDVYWSVYTFGENSDNNLFTLNDDIITRILYSEGNEYTLTYQISDSYITETGRPYYKKISFGVYDPTPVYRKFLKISYDIRNIGQLYPVRFYKYKKSNIFWDYKPELYYDKVYSDKID